MNEYQEIRDILKRVSLAHEQHAKEMEKIRESQKKNSEEHAKDMKELRQIQKETDRIVKEIAEELKETDRIVKETAEQLKENSQEFAKEMKELRAFQKETAEQLKETDRIVRQISKDFGGFSNNAARETEEFFSKAIEKKELKIKKVQFDWMGTNVVRKSSRKGGREIEIDILLLNSQVLSLVEVKSTLHQNDVKNFLEKQIPLFRSCFPEHRDKKIIGMVAGKVVNAEARELAHKAGLTILTPKGGELLIDDSCQRELN